MNLLKHVSGFFSTVDYTTKGASLCEDNSWSGKAESWANTCQKPARWIANQLWHGGRSYCVILEENDEVEKVFRKKVNPVTGFQKVVRSVAGLALCIPGLIASIPLMGFAYVASPEIRLKHRFAVLGLTDEDKNKLNQMIADRQKLADEEEECEPVTCFLGTIVCLLCYVVCYNRN